MKSPTKMIFWLCCLTYSILVMNNTLAKPNVLIHPHSLESPFFQSNPSIEERTKRYLTQSNIRANNISRAFVPWLYLTRRSDYFLATICIGTYNSVPSCNNNYMIVDTGSSFTWLECEGCKRCSNHMYRLFNPRNSSSYRSDLKPYESRYKDGSYSKGVLARETFYFQTKNRNKYSDSIKNLEFGCGFDNIIKFDRQNYNTIAGVLGLGSHKSSFVNQLGHFSNGIFSYCFPSIYDSYLTFGDAKIKPEIAQNTKLYTRRDTGNYFVELIGISINKIRLKINPGIFGFKRSNGLIIDTSIRYSRIVSPAFDILKQGLENYFSKLKNFRRVNDTNLELCYESQNMAVPRLNDLPGVITFHFGGSKADFVMKGSALYTDSTYFKFCLAMIRDPQVSILGNHQQVDQRMSFDTKRGLLFFHQEQCNAK